MKHSCFMSLFRQALFKRNCDSRTSSADIDSSQIHGRPTAFVLCDVCDTFCGVSRRVVARGVIRQITLQRDATGARSALSANWVLNN